jgi:hypothetical protein
VRFLLSAEHDIEFQLCLVRKVEGLGMMSKAGNQVSAMGRSTIRVFAAVLLTGLRKHRCTERIQTHEHGQMEE